MPHSLSRLKFRLIWIMGPKMPSKIWITIIDLCPIVNSITIWVILCEINTGRNHPDSDLSVIHYIGLFCPKKKLVKVKKLNSQNFSKYAPLKSDRGVSSFVIIWIRIIENKHMIVIFIRKRMLFLMVMHFFNFRWPKKN